MRKTRKILITAAITAGVAVPTAIAGAAFAHGYNDNPPSRQALCHDGTVSDCGDIQYEPQSVEAPKGFPSAGPADGSICSGGHGNFAQLDDPRGGDWPATSINTGAQTFHWTLTAQHSTDKWEYFITKDGWDPSKALTRDALEPEPFFSQSDGGAKPPASVDLNVDVPSNKHGRHLILGVWTIADTSNAFYSCMDVNIA